MIKRSPAAVVIFSILTCFIYAVVWFVKTKNEMNRMGAWIPTAWLLVVPFANLYWLWQWAAGVQRVTGGKQSQGNVFLLIWLLSLVGMPWIGMAIVQSELNDASDRRLPVARVA